MNELSLLKNILHRIGVGMRQYIRIALSRPYEIGVLVCSICSIRMRYHELKIKLDYLMSNIKE